MQYWELDANNYTNNNDLNTIYKGRPSDKKMYVLALCRVR